MERNGRAVKVGREPNTALVFHAHKAVGIIVQDGVGDSHRHTGGFFSPEEARRLASLLNEAADLADSEPQLTTAERARIVADFMRNF